MNDKFKSFFIFITIIASLALAVFLGYIAFDVAFHLGMAK